MPPEPLRRDLRSSPPFQCALRQGPKEGKAPPGPPLHHDWKRLGLREAQLELSTVASGYVEYAAPAWLPAPSPSHVEQLDLEIRAVARAITGCRHHTAMVPLLAEAGLVPARVRRGVLVARMLSSAISLPPDDPLRLVVESNPPRSLTTTTGWRWLGAQALRLSSVQDIPVEEHLHMQLPPWTRSDRVAIRLDLGTTARRDAPDALRRETAEAHLRHLSTLPTDAT